MSSSRPTVEVDAELARVIFQAWLDHVHLDDIIECCAVCMDRPALRRELCEDQRPVCLACARKWSGGFDGNGMHIEDIENWNGDGVTPQPPTSGEVVADEDSFLRLAPNGKVLTRDRTVRIENHALQLAAARLQRALATLT